MLWLRIFKAILVGLNTIKNEKNAKELLKIVNFNCLRFEVYEPESNPKSYGHALKVAERVLKLHMSYVMFKVGSHK